jgi:hypothetical protein
MPLSVYFGATLVAIGLLTHAPASTASMPSPRAASVDGEWYPIAPITPRASHAAILDPVRRRLIVIGGYGETYFNDVWELSLDGPPEWKLIVPSGTPPSPRYGHTAIYDPIRDRIVVFGGFGLGLISNETWELTLSGSPAWNRLVTPTSPPARANHVAIYDPVRDRMVVFGGTTTGSVVLGDVWALSLSGPPEWTALSPGGTGPVRSTSAAIYDPARDRMIVFGGWNGAGVQGDSWSLDFAPSPAWSTIIAGGGAPGPRQGASAIYDPVGDRMILLGGLSSAYPPYPMNQVWSLDLGSGGPTWSLHTTAGTTPTARFGQSAVYDPLGIRIVMFGGAAQFPTLNDVRDLDLSSPPSMTWVFITAARHPDLLGQKAALDPLRDRMVVVNYDSRVMSYDLAARSWSTWTSSGSPPPSLSWGYPSSDGERPDFSLIHDPVRDRLILFGGGTRHGVWTLTLGGTPTWSMLATVGTPPNASADHATIYDPVRDRMLVFGGIDQATGTLYNELWQLSLAGTPTWTQLATSGGPPDVRRKASAIYDPDHDRMVVFGGNGTVRHSPGGDASVLADLWTLDLSAPVPVWSPQPSAPSGRYGHTAVYDAARRRMLLFGGASYYFYYVTTEYPYNDVWSLDLSGAPAWTMLAPTGRLPLKRIAHSAVFDPRRDAMIVVAGEVSSNHSDYQPVSDPMTLIFGNAPTATAVSLVRLDANRDGVSVEWYSASGTTATVSRRRVDGPWDRRTDLVADGAGRFLFEDHDVLPGGRYGYRIEIHAAAGDVATGEIWVDVPREIALDLGGLTPNPGRGALSVSFASPTAGPATIELIDAGGRRVLQRRVAVAAGRHLLPLAPAGAVAPGTYFLRLRQGTAERTRRCTVLE